MRAEAPAVGPDLKGQMHRAAQYRDVQLAVNARRVRRAAGAVKRTVSQPRSRSTADAPLERPALAVTAPTATGVSSWARARSVQARRAAR